MTESFQEGSNPYASPGEAKWIEPTDEERCLIATFDVGSWLNYRALRIESEQTLWWNQGILALQLVVFLVLMAGLVYGWPWVFVLSSIGLLVTLNLGQMVFPHWRTYRRLRKCEQTGDWPIPWGPCSVEVTRDELMMRRGLEERRWRLRDLSSVLYLGDLLLVVPELGIYLPIPRDADFGPDTFASFCRLFAIRFST